MTYYLLVIIETEAIKALKNCPGLNNGIQLRLAIAVMLLFTDTQHNDLQ